MAPHEVLATKVLSVAGLMKEGKRRKKENDAQRLKSGTEK
jgi:hypothetical protein